MNKLITTGLLLLITSYLSAQVAVSKISCEYQSNPIGIDARHPVLGWQLSSGKRNVKQIAYRILVADDSLKLDKGVCWDTKMALSDQSIQIVYDGTELKSTKTYYWKVMVWDNYGGISRWSKTGKWQMGLLNKADWKNANWIAYDKLADSLKIIPGLTNPGDERWSKGTDILPLLRKEFAVTKKIKKATAFITGLGQFEMSLNGKKVGDHFLDPGWTKFDKQTLYLTFDITNQLKQGENAIGVALGNGFYYIPGERYHKLKNEFGHPKMICRLLIEYEDGTNLNVISDQSWKTTKGPVTFSSIYGGEDYNASLNKPGWNRIGFNDKNWKSVTIVDGPEKLEAQEEAPLKIFDRFPVKTITHPKPGVWVYDMGQNASAIPQLRVSGKKGAVVKLTPAELLDDGGLVTQAAVGVPVYFNYTLKGGVAETWHPQFMYYGFRYIQVEGAVPQNKPNSGHLPVILNIKSLHTRNSAAVAGSFSCSNNLFNKTYNLINWAIKSNTASIFTDCPHRRKTWVA